MVSASHRFADIHVPKTGGTSRKESLIKAGVSVFPDMDHEPIHRLIEVVPKFDEYYTFSFRRNPLDVAASLFFYWRDGLEDENPHKLPYDSDFKVWVKGYVNELPSSKVRELWAHSFYWKDKKGDIAVDDIFILDNINIEWPRICNRIGVDFKPLERLNASICKPLDLSGLYDEECAKIIHARFEEDYDLLGVPNNWVKTD